jgi:hypothetical protein
MTTKLRDPRQVKTLDDVTLRREMKHLLSAEYLLDHTEELELLDQSNQGGRYNALRARVLRQGLYGNGGPRLLSDGERTALALYVLEQGPRPRWARLASGDGHFGPGWLQAGDPDAPAPGPAWPTPDPDEPSRYVKAKGEYAIPSDQR